MWTLAVKANAKNTKTAPDADGQFFIGLRRQQDRKELPPNMITAIRPSAFPVQKPVGTPRFGLNQLGPFVLDASGQQNRKELPLPLPLNACMITDFGDGSSTNEAAVRFEDVSNFIATHQAELRATGWLPPGPEPLASTFRQPKISFISDVAHIDYQSLTLNRLGGSRPNHDVFIHVCDPGVGVQATHDRSILVTECHGMYVGPNNGSLGLVAASMDARGEAYKLIPIDFNKVRALECLRLGDPGYEFPHTFHGRDVFAVVGAAIANGIAPEKFQDDRLAGSVPVWRSAFSSGASVLPLQVGEKRKFYGFRDKTSGNIKTDLMVSLSQRDALIANNALYRLSWQNPDFSWNQLVMPFKGFFSQVQPGAPLCYAGSSYAPYPGYYLEEFALNQGEFSAVLNLPLGQTKEMVLERIQ